MTSKDDVPVASQRRAPAVRRPRVAGLRSRTAPDSPHTATPPPPERAGLPGADAARRRPRVATLVALVAVLLVASGLAVWFRGETAQLTDSAAAANDALVDASATAQVNGQITEALETAFSYDYTTLDRNERAARQVITGQFASEFDQQFSTVRELAPQQQAVVSATVSHSAVKMLSGDSAIVVAFLDQQVTRSGTDQEMIAAGRLTVTAQRVDGQWKIAGVQSH